MYFKMTKFGFLQWIKVHLAGVREGYCWGALQGLPLCWHQNLRHKCWGQTKTTSKLYRMMRIEILRWCHLNGSSKLDLLRGSIWEMISGCQGFSQIINPNHLSETQPNHLLWCNQFLWRYILQRVGEDFGVVVTFDPKVKSSFRLYENFCAVTHKKILRTVLRSNFDNLSLSAANGWRLEWGRRSHKLLHWCNEVALTFLRRKIHWKGNKKKIWNKIFVS